MGRLLREFSLTLTFAIVVSTVVSLTVTPMICAHYIKGATSTNATRFDRLVEGPLSRIVAFYTRTLRVVLRFPVLTLLVFFATIALTVTLISRRQRVIFRSTTAAYNRCHARVGRRFLSVHAWTSTTRYGYRNGRSCGAGNRSFCRRRRRAEAQIEDSCISSRSRWLNGEN